MIPLIEPNLNGNEKKYLQKAINDNYVSSHGIYLDKFQKKIKDLSKSKYAILTSSGSSALHVSLLTLGVLKNDLVIMPSFTFIATANSIKLTGADPWLFDVSKSDLNLDLDLLEKELEKNTYFKKDGYSYHKKNKKRVSAVIIVFALGHPGDLKSLKKISKKYNLKIVIDAAAALGSTINNQPLGNFNIDMIVFSFNGNKNITSGGGGAIITNNSKYYKLSKQFSSNAKVGFRYLHNKIGFNYKMNNIQAAIGLAQIERIKKILSNKKKIFSVYKKNLSSIKEINFFPQKKNFQSTFWYSGFFLLRGFNKFRKFLMNSGIECREFWIPIHLQIPYKDCLKTKMKNCNSIWKKIVVLPSSSNLNYTKQVKVIKVIKSFF